jgi:hypothetical protein
VARAFENFLLADGERLVQRALEGPARKRSVGAAQVLGRP